MRHNGSDRNKCIEAQVQHVNNGCETRLRTESQFCKEYAQFNMISKQKLFLCTIRAVSHY